MTHVRLSIFSIILFIFFAATLSNHPAGASEPGADLNAGAPAYIRGDAPGDEKMIVLAHESAAEKGKETGRFFKKTGKRTGNFFAEAGKKTGNFFAEAGKKTGNFFAEAGKKTGGFFKKIFAGN